MSKIICDICGTVYPDNANVCPICGYPRSDSEKAAEETGAVAGGAAAAASTRTKGGRFSNKNVKKRNQAESRGSDRRERKEREDREPEEKKNGKGMIVIVALLAVAVALVTGYILWRFIAGRDAYDNPAVPQIGTNPPAASTSEPTTLPADADVPCVDMIISDSSVEFLGAERSWKLSVIPSPEDTTDEVTYVSSDESVVTVTDDGRLISVGPGTATITITCGDVVKECQVVCNFEGETEPEETTEPAETTLPVETTEPEETTEANTDGFQLDRSDVTLFAPGETFTFGVTFNGERLSVAQVEWKSEDSAIATVENGKVTAVSEGKTTIVATYNGQKQECIIRCRFDEDVTVPTTEKTYADTNWKMNNKYGDVTLIPGESFTLKLTNDAGETADVTWVSSNEGVVKIDGNVITGKTVGYTELTATVSGQTFKCIVRVIAHR